MDIEKVFNKILLFDYDNDENVSKFIQQIIPIINEHMKEYTKLIDELRKYTQTLEYEIDDIAQCPYAYCKYDDLKEDLEEVLYKTKRR
jgi:hypothetical protein